MRFESKRPPLGRIFSKFGVVLLMSNNGSDDEGNRDSSPKTPGRSAEELRRLADDLDKRPGKPQEPQKSTTPRKVNQEEQPPQGPEHNRIRAQRPDKKKELGDNPKPPKPLFPFGRYPFS